MTEFTISVADVPIRILALYSSTKVFCSDYLSEAEPEWTIVSTIDKIMREAEISGLESKYEGKEQIRIGAAYLEQLAVYREIAEGLVDRNILLFHASALAVDGRVFLFAGKSEVGKSTHAGLWRQKLGNRVLMVNDDKPLLRITDTDILACGTPWNGKESLGNNVILPVQAICFLERAEKNEITQITPWEATPLMIQQSYMLQDDKKRIKILKMIDWILSNIPSYRLRCNNLEYNAAEVACLGMGVQM